MLLVILRLSILYIGHSALSNIDRQRRANLGFKIRSILDRQAHQLANCNSWVHRRVGLSKVRRSLCFSEMLSATA